MKDELENVKNFMSSEKERKKYIELFVEKLYARFNYLFSESLEEVKEKALNKYLYTEPYYNLSYNEISAQMVEEIERRKKEYEDKKNMPVVEEKPTEVVTQPPIIQPVEVPTSSPIIEPTEVITQPVTEPVVANTYEPITPVEVVSESNETITPVENELNAMVSEPVEVKNEVSENTDNKQLVKNNDKQRGSAGLLNIILAILTITAFVLIAMILNLLLK